MKLKHVASYSYTNIVIAVTTGSAYILMTSPMPNSDVDVRTKFIPKSTAAKVFADDDDDNDFDNDEIDTGSESSGKS